MHIARGGMQPVEEIEACDAEQFERKVRPAYRPVVIRGLAKDWPLVVAGKRDASNALSQIERLDSGEPAELMIAPANENGRFFYSPDMRGFNFRRDRATLTQLANQLRSLASSDEPLGIYAGASEIARHLPGFLAENPLPLIDAMQATPRIWIGNATQVATHFDLSDNIAIVAAGQRRFTLFPPEATPDLYPGPLNITLAGQPVSMVDPLNPDLDRYPNFVRALEIGLVTDLEPGDAIYIPTLWWHHVAASAPINILVNYWHNDASRGGGFLSLVHAMLAIREQPQPQREAWRAWFDHFVFGPDAAGAADHLPLHGRGVNGPASPQRDEQMRRFIIQVLGSP